MEEPGQARNVCLGTLMQELWPRAPLAWNKWAPYRDNRKEQEEKARRLMRSGFSPAFVLTKVDLSMGELVMLKNRLCS
jgi:hypothetical protein